MNYIKYIPCYCGGFVKFISKEDRRLKTGWRWVIKNCYPERGEDKKPSERNEIFRRRLKVLDGV